MNKTKVIVHAVNYDYGVINDVHENTHGIFDEVHLMPDTHRGATVPIGFVAKVSEDKGVIPEVVSNDIGCGMTVYEIGKLPKNIDWKAFYDHINKYIPSGAKLHEKGYEYDFSKMKMPLDKNIIPKYYQSLGTLGGGNHFIEINVGIETDYIVVHSGSRRLGADVCKYYTELLKFDKNKYTQDLKEALEKVEPKKRQEFVKNFKNVYDGQNTKYLTGQNAKDYLNDMKIAQEFASKSREIMIRHLVKFFGVKFDKNNLWESVHNYIDFEDMYVRKGATPARMGQKVIIPINMRDGSIIGIGKGNKDWFYSAPHGAGRVLSRSQAKANISLDEYKNALENSNVVSYSVNESTIDESPQAYRPIEEIMSVIHETIDIVEVAKPIFNFKASEVQFDFKNK